MSILHKNREYFSNTDWTVSQVKKEIDAGLAILNSINQDAVTFFGSHLVKPGSNEYAHAKQLASALGRKGYAVISGGGPGIMHAANSGATEAGVPSIGFRAELLKGERVTDRIFTAEQSFHFLFVRRFIMSIKSEALIFYPGGFGTLNELFEFAVLMQTGIVDRVPIICVNKKYWDGLFRWLRENPLKNEYLIDETDMDLLFFEDDVGKIVGLIEKRKR